MIVHGTAWMCVCTYSVHAFAQVISRSKGLAWLLDIAIVNNAVFEHVCLAITTLLAYDSFLM